MKRKARVVPTGGSNYLSKVMTGPLRVKGWPGGSPFTGKGQMFLLMSLRVHRYVQMVPRG